MLLPGQNFVLNFTLPQNGQGLVNFDSTPTAILCRNGVDQSASAGGVSAANVSTGRYQVSGFIPANWVGGDWIDLIVTGSVSAASVVRVLPLGAIDAVQPISEANVTDWLGETPQALDDAGNLMADLSATLGWGGTPLPTPVSRVPIDQTTLVGQTIIVQSPVGNGTLTIVEEDAYLAADNRQLTWSKPAGANWPTDLANWTITFTATRTPQNTSPGTTATISASGNVNVATGNGQQVQVQLSSAQTTGLAIGAGLQGYAFDVVATNGVDRATLVTGLMTVLANVTP